MPRFTLAVEYKRISNLHVTCQSGEASSITNSLERSKWTCSSSNKANLGSLSLFNTDLLATVFLEHVSDTSSQLSPVMSNTPVTHLFLKILLVPKAAMSLVKI